MDLAVGWYTEMKKAEEPLKRRENVLRCLKAEYAVSHVGAAEWRAGGEESRSRRRGETAICHVERREEGRGNYGLSTAPSGWRVNCSVAGFDLLTSTTCRPGDQQ
ncbi:hypothetical protein AOLI_G00097570 [Acnodon oligacanthus]